MMVMMAALGTLGALRILLEIGDVRLKLSECLLQCVLRHAALAALRALGALHTLLEIGDVRLKLSECLL